ncbi:MAG TPA: DUF1579 family protein [Allosphingosinicella sp.]|jgi:hypothetical protein
MLVALALAAAAPAPPPCSTPEYRQLDFWVGDWDGEFDLPGGKTGRATNRITRNEYGDCVIAEHFDQPDTGFVGASFSTWDRHRKKWVQTWVDSGGGYITLAGGPVEGQAWSFELVTLEPRGPQQVHSRMIWQDVKPESFTWRWQARQADGSYTDSWVIRYKRRK